VKRLVVFLALAIFPASAYAQSPEAGADELSAEIDGDYAQAQSNDCDTACRALDSMRRATDRLCVLDPGDRCARTRQKLADATARVRSACPGCAEPAGGTFSDESKAAGAPAPPTNAPAEETVQKKSGGCAGCTLGGYTSGSAEGAGWLLALALAMRRLRARARQRRTS
jgi:hypothetical protein